MAEFLNDLPERDLFEQNGHETFDIIGPGHSYGSVTDKIAGVVLTSKVSARWLLAVALAAGLTGLLGLAVLITLLFGVGLWGNNQPNGWAFGIINFVWWIGIGHAGTLISAILLLLHQNWRTSINRYAEAMTIFAVMQAGLFPLLHIGRHYYAYWMFPVPNSMALWPQFRSPLMWDVFAISTYITVSVLFWFVGLLPDLATLRDRATHRWAKLFYGVLAMGWRGSALHWRRYMMLYLILAGLSTPLVLSVHTIVSFDFSVGIVPGWHSTIFPPYFVAGAVYAGFAMTLILAIPMRKVLHLEDLITMRHLENMGKVMLTTGLIVFYGYIMEVLFGWYSANTYEKWMTFNNRMLGPYNWSYWSLILCNGLVPQLLWKRSIRTNTRWLFFISVVVSIGMWLERFVIIVTSLSQEYLPGMWAIYKPTIVDISILVGTIGFFFLLFLLFARLLPVISIAEMRELILHHGHAASFTEHLGNHDTSGPGDGGTGTRIHPAPVPALATAGGPAVIPSSAPRAPSPAPAEPASPAAAAPPASSRPSPVTPPSAAPPAATPPPAGPSAAGGSAEPEERSQPRGRASRPRRD